MSDIVLGALIGFSAAILGSIITGIINYKNSKLQISARRDELNQQQNYNAQQAQIERLIKTRENVLIPLREVVSKWMEASKQEQQMIVRLKTAYEREGNLQERAKEDKLWEEASDKANQVKSELEVLQGQMSDATLNQMIETAKESYFETAQERVKLQLIVINPQRSDTNSRLIALKKYRSILNNLRGYLLTVNKRIEELLSGGPSN